MKIRGPNSRTYLDRFTEKYIPEPNTGCWLWIGAISSGGYGVFGSEYGLVSAHRWAFEFFNYKIPRGKFACHRCDTRSCVNPSHIFIGSQKDNIQDCIFKHRFQMGAKHSKSKLSEDDVLRIRISYAKNQKNIKLLCSEYRVTKGTIRDIIKRKTWKSI